jgi:hypothetical protein
MQHALMFVPIARKCLVEKRFYDEDPDWAASLVYTHLELHLHEMGGPLTAEQQEEAERMARFLLDDEIDLSQLDDPPTVAA